MKKNELSQRLSLLFQISANHESIQISAARYIHRSSERVIHGNYQTVKYANQKAIGVVHIREQSRVLFGAVRWNSTAVKDTPEVSEVVKVCLLV